MLTMKEISQLVSALMHSRQTILPKRLLQPGPDATELELILGAAASAPDHGALLPWRFVLVTAPARKLLAQAFEDALSERDPQALPEHREQAREKAFRAPCLLLVVVDAESGDTSVDYPERLISAGCAIQNMLLMATALEFGSAITSGKALKAQGLRALFALQPGEHALCFVSIGSVQGRKPERLRPQVNDYVTRLDGPGMEVPFTTGISP